MRFTTLLSTAREDDQLVANMTASALQEEGYLVHHCATADAVMEVLQGAGQYDILFTDVVMPGRLSRVDLAKWCISYRPDIAVVVTTGCAENLAGIPTTVLRKPCDTSELFRTLEKAAGEA
jgi:DNA-binding NtrC family response regulator